MKKLSLRVWVMIGTIVLLVFVIGLLLLGNANSENSDVQLSVHQETTESAKPSQESTGPSTDIVIYGEQELGDMILVETSFCSLKYPFALSDVIKIEPQGQTLVFSARVQSGTYPIYTIHFCGDGEHHVGVIRLPNESQEQPVSVVFHDLPQGLSQDDERTFLAARDTFTEVWLSLGENENVTLAE